MCYALLSLFLCITSMTYNMELEKTTHTQEEKYALFKENPDEAYKVISRNSEELTSLFIYGNQQQDPEFIQWLLVTKKPLIEDLYIKEPNVDQSTLTIDFILKDYNPAITLILRDYIELEIKKNQAPFKDFQKQKILIQKYKDDQSQCTCTIS